MQPCLCPKPHLNWQQKVRKSWYIFEVSISSVYCHWHKVKLIKRKKIKMSGIFWNHLLDLQCVLIANTLYGMPSPSPIFSPYINDSYIDKLHVCAPQFHILNPPTQLFSVNEEWSSITPGLKNRHLSRMEYPAWQVFSHQTIQGTRKIFSIPDSLGQGMYYGGVIISVVYKSFWYASHITTTPTFCLLCIKE